MKNYIIISFLGTDGSGKTTLIKKLIKKLKSKKYLIKSHHLKPSLVKNKRSKIVKFPHKQTPRSNILSFFKIIQWLLIYRFYFFGKFFYPKQVHLFDRYADDLLIDPIRYRFKLNINLSKFLLSFFPRPDLWIILSGDPKEIWRRKKEIDFKVLKKLTLEYIKFSKDKKNILFFRKNKDFKIIEKKIINLIK